MISDLLDARPAMGRLLRRTPVLFGVMALASLSACTTLTSSPIAATTPVHVAGPSSHALATRDADPVPTDLLHAPAADSGQVPLADDDATATMVDPISLDPKALARFGDLWAHLNASHAISVDDNPRIHTQLAWFMGHQTYVDRMTARASRYLAYTVAQAEARHMPIELALLPIIESAYDPFAVSSAQAAGIWQFVPGTAQVYGLRQSWWHDGRRDILDSTAAAYTFLADLYRKYHDWNLVLAAYNAGPGIVDRAIARNQAANLPSDYWSLDLPAETMAYVPRFLAVVDIVRHADRYGVHLTPIIDQPYFRVISLSKPIDLKAAAKAGCDAQELTLLNPGLKHAASDPQGPLRLLVPAQTSASFDLALQQLPAPERMLTQRYRVRHGDTIYHIARHFDMDVAQLLSLNHLHHLRLHRGQVLEVMAQNGDTPQATRQEHHLRLHHRESIAHLARRLHISATRLAEWNDTTPHHLLRAGSVITILDQAPGKDSDRHRIHYAVRRGDTLFSISRRYRVSVSAIRSWNHRHLNLHPGQDLVIYIASNNDDEG